MRGSISPFFDAGSGGSGLPAASTPTPDPIFQPTSVRLPTDGAVQTGSQLWMRRWKLSVGTPQGQGVDLSQLSFQFQVEQNAYIPPWTATIKVWNINPNTIARLQKELTRVSLWAGYQQPSLQYGSLFEGYIAYYRSGRESATDTFVEIHAGSSDQPVNDAMINATLPAGWTHADVIDLCIQAMSPWGVKKGQITDLGSAKSPRARTLHGMARDILRDEARTARAQVFIDQDLALHILKEGEVIRTSATVTILNSRSGMVDIPVMTMDGGIEVHSLLNPALKPGRPIKINQKDVTGLTDVNSGAFPGTQLQLSSQQDSNGNSIAFHADGIYKILSARHFGQNRGQPWFSHLVTMPTMPAQVGIKTTV